MRELKVHDCQIVAPMIRVRNAMNDGKVSQKLNKVCVDSRNIGGSERAKFN
jgi:hypothetical protein